LIRVDIQPLAQVEAEFAAQWYEKQRPGLGLEFVLELDAALERVAQSPENYPLQYRHARRVLLRRFPYAVYFTWINERINAFAVLHQRQAASNWESRLP